MTLLSLVTILLFYGQSIAGATEEYVNQILEPTGGEILRPKDWFYSENHGGPRYTWILSKEDISNGSSYTTGVKIQTFVHIKNGTGKTSKEFIIGQLEKIKKSADKVIKTCEESKQDLFTRVCVETEEGAYRIMYSLFWGNNSDLAVISIAGTKKELWDEYSPIFDKMAGFKLIDMKRFEK